MCINIRKWISLLRVDLPVKIPISCLDQMLKPLPLSTQLTCSSEMCMLLYHRIRLLYTYILCMLMGESSTYSLVVITVIWCLRGAKTTEFVMSPQSINATLNSTVIFTCQATEISGFVWRINNNSQLTPPPSSSGDMSRLEVFCSDNRDMSIVECGGFLPNFSRIFSDPALLRIQGLLASVTNLSVNSTTTSITLTWDPPTSLDITGVEPDFTHTVEVYNITSGDRQEVCVYENITDSNFTFTLCEDESQSNDFSDGDGGMNQTSDGGTTMDQSNKCCCTLVNPDLSELFQFVVTAINAVGRGEPSTVNVSFQETISANIQTSSVALTTVNSTVTVLTTESSSTNEDGKGGTIASGSDCTTVAVAATTVAVTVVISLATLVLGVILGVVMTLLMVFIGVRVRQQPVQETTDVDHPDCGEIEMKSCDAYDVARKRKQVKNKPPVYEEVA